MLLGVRLDLSLALGAPLAIAGGLYPAQHKPTHIDHAEGVVGARGGRAESGFAGRAEAERRGEVRVRCGIRGMDGGAGEHGAGARARAEQRERPDPQLEGFL